MILSKCYNLCLEGTEDKKVMYTTGGAYINSFGVGEKATHGKLSFVCSSCKAFLSVEPTIQKVYQTQCPICKRNIAFIFPISELLSPSNYNIKIKSKSTEDIKIKPLRISSTALLFTGLNISINILIHAYSTFLNDFAVNKCKKEGLELKSYLEISLKHMEYSLFRAGGCLDLNALSSTEKPDSYKSYAATLHKTNNLFKGLKTYSCAVVAPNMEFIEEDLIAQYPLLNESYLAMQTSSHYIVYLPLSLFTKPFLKQVISAIVPNISEIPAKYDPYPYNCVESKKGKVENNVCCRCGLKQTDSDVCLVCS